MADCFLKRHQSFEFCTDGIIGMFDMDTIDIANARWINKIDGGNEINLYNSFTTTEDLGHTALQISSTGCGEIVMTTQPATYYVVARAVTKATNWSAFIGKRMTYNTSAYLYDYATYFDSGSSAPQPMQGENFSTTKVTAPCDKYHVICRYKGGLIIDGEIIINTQDISTQYYGEGMELHRLYRKGWISGAWTANYLFVAFANDEHTQTQAIQNCKYLMRKYNIS